MRRRVTEFEETIGPEAWGSIENSSLRLLEMLDKSNQAYLLIRHGRFEFLNRTCVEMFGYSHVEWSSLPSLFEKVIHPDDREMVRKYCENRVEPHISHHRYVCRIVCKDGSLKWLDIQSSSILWKDEPAFLAVATDISQHIELQKSLEEKTHSLAKRVKELNCLNRISELIHIQGLSQPQILQNIVDLIPTAWRYPEVTCARISVDGEEFETSSHRNCVFKQSEEIIVDGSRAGFVEVGYLEQRPESDEGAFLKEERNLIKAIAEHIGQIILRKRVEEELRQSEKRFRSFIESAPDAIFVQTKGCFAYVNKATQELFGVDSPDSLLGTPVGEHFHPSDQKAVKQRIHQLNLAKNPFPGREEKCIRQDGSIVSVEVSAVPIRYESEDGALVFARDLTERLKTEQEKARLFTAIEQAAASVLITSADGTIEYGNPAFEKITGYAVAEIIGKNPKLLQSGNHDKEFYEDLWNTISRGNVWNGRIINRRKDGSLVYEEGAISPVKDADGNIVNFVQVTQDVTKEVELQNQLVQAQKLEAIGTLAGGIAHDFNNVIFAITGFTELAMLDLPPESTARSNLGRVMEAARRSGDMVKQILAFSRQGETEITTLDLRPLVKEGLKFLRAAIPTTIEISQEIEPDLGKILGDPTQIHQVLMNLCVNASHAIKDNKGTISVELSEVELDADFTTENPPLAPGKHLRLTVTDTGTGIPSEIMHKIFDPYFTTKEEGKGTGLGLSVVQGIMEKHNGAITITSELGKGSTFSVFFPVIDREEQPAELDSATNVTPTGKERILVLDDESHLLEMYDRQLRQLGYEVTCSSNPLEALDLFRRNPRKFDLVITDLTMPKMTGLELARELSSIRPGIPIILCSGVSQVVSDSESKLAGIQTVIYKPIRRQKIAQTIRNAMDTELGDFTLSSVMKSAK
jgi:PAS domain S-box-containing protein